MRFRLLAAAAVTTALGAGLVPAQATPYAGQFEFLSVGTVTFQGADGARWLLALTATASGPLESRPEQKLYLDLSRCAASSCVSMGKWSRPLTAAEVSISAPNALVDTEASKGELHTVLGGANLDVTIDRSSNVGGGYANGLGSSTAPPGVSPAFVTYTFAAGRLRLAGVTCRVFSGELGRITTVDTVGDDARDPRTAPPAHLPAGFLTGKQRLSC